MQVILFLGPRKFKALPPLTRISMVHANNRCHRRCIEPHFGVLWSRTVAEHITCSLMLLGFVPMHSNSQRFVSVASWATAFTAITRVQIHPVTQTKQYS